MSLDLFLGHTASGVPVTVSKASNPHIFVTGRSGSGKSYFLKGLLAQASKQGAACLVFDYTGDYRNYTPPKDMPFQRILVSGPEFTINPLLDTAGQSPKLLAQQLLSLIHGAFRLGNRRSLNLLKATIAYLEAEQGVPSIGKLIDSIPPVQENRVALDILGYMDTLISCGDVPISLDHSAAGISVLDFSEFADIQQRNLVVSMVLNVVWMLRTMNPDITDTAPVVLLLDEAQTLPWGHGSMARRILSEGRKYGLAGWFASQWIRNKEAVTALEQAYLRIYFRPDNENLTRLSRRLVQGNPQCFSECVQLLRTLHVGQFILHEQGDRLVKVAQNERERGAGEGKKHSETTVHFNCIS